jgi:hypothetical protein
MNSFNDMRDHRNLEIEIDPEYILANPQNQWIINEILRSPDRPDTTDRSINVMEGLLTPRYVRYITDTDAWFICSAAGTNPFRVYMNQAMETDQDMDFDTDAAKFKATIIHSQGATEWRGSYGSPGA